MFPFIARDPLISTSNKFSRKRRVRCRFGKKERKKEKKKERKKIKERKKERKKWVKCRLRKKINKVFAFRASPTFFMQIYRQ